VWRCLLACLGLVALFFFFFCGLVFDKFAVRKYDNKLVEMGWEDLAGLQALAEIYGDVAMDSLLAHYSALLSWLSFSPLPGGTNAVLPNCGFWSQTLTR